MLKKKLDKKMRTLWLIHATIFSVMCIMCYLVLLLVPDKYRFYCMLVGGIVLAINIFLQYIFAVLRYKFYFYYLEDGVIYIEHGIIFKHRIIIPCIKLQDVHLNSGPIMRALGLKSLELSTAGSNFSIAGIREDESLSLVKEIKKLAGDISE